MPYSFGLNCKAYRLPSGTKRVTWGPMDGDKFSSGAAPAGLIEVDGIKDVTVKLEKGEEDVSTRGDNGIEVVACPQRKFTVEFDMPVDPEDADYAAFLRAYMGGKTIAMTFLTGARDAVGSHGPWADWEVLKCEDAQPIKGVEMAKIELKPGRGPTPSVGPEYVIVA